MRPTIDPLRAHLVERFRFFLANAGYVVGRRAQGALELARAEARAEDEGLSFVWEADEDGYWSAVHDGDIKSGGNDEMLWCRCVLPCAICARHAGTNDPDKCPHAQILASLYSIINPDRDYRRVVEAELALEALAHLPNQTDNA